MKIPDNYVVRADSAETYGRRSVTVRRYSTSIPVDRNEILLGVEKGELQFGKEFGIIKGYDLDEPDRNLRILCGRVGERNIVLVREDTNELDYFRLKHVLLSTLMIEFVLDSGRRLELLVYGDIRAKNHLWEMLKYDFGINPEPTPRYFRPESVRAICNRFFDRLQEININPQDQDGWETIRAADFKAYRGQFIDPNADRMNQVKRNLDIMIRSFQSVLYEQLMHPMIQPCNVKFSLLQDSGITFEIPELELPSAISEIEYELTFYDFVRELYQSIVQDDGSFQAPSTRLVKQLVLVNIPSR